MSLVRVQVWDATATKRQEVEMPDDAPVNRILAVLLEKMNFPQYAPDGQPLSYSLRATQVYRREEGEWKVAHRHADAVPDREEP